MAAKSGDNFDCISGVPKPQNVPADERFGAPIQALPHLVPPWLCQCPATFPNAPQSQDLRIAPSAASHLIQDEEKSGERPKHIDDLILDVLTMRVRVLSVRQICDLCGDIGERGLLATRRRVERLERKGMLHVLSGLAHPELPLLAPVVTWKPAESLPDFGTIAEVLMQSTALQMLLTPDDEEVIRAFNVTAPRYGKRPWHYCQGRFF